MATIQDLWDAALSNSNHELPRCFRIAMSDGRVYEGLPTIVRAGDGGTFNMHLGGMRKITGLRFDDVTKVDETSAYSE